MGLNVKVTQDKTIEMPEIVIVKQGP